MPQHRSENYHDVAVRQMDSVTCCLQFLASQSQAAIRGSKHFIFITYITHAKDLNTLTNKCKHILDNNLCENTPYTCIGYLAICFTSLCANLLKLYTPLH